ncbi:hypothetical protein AB1N83_008192 [Pleurotus pulmonarius]
MRMCQRGHRLRDAFLLPACRLRDHIVDIVIYYAKNSEPSRGWRDVRIQQNENARRGCVFRLSQGSEILISFNYLRVSGTIKLGPVTAFPQKANPTDDGPATLLD